MVQRRLGYRCVLMDRCRAVALFGAVAASMVDWLGKDIADIFSGDGSTVRWWWGRLKRVHAVYALGMQQWVYAPGTSCGWIGGDLGSRWWGVMAFSIVVFVGVGDDFRLFDVCSCHTFVK